jgi:RNA polymerase sigma-70 factor (ECF subfamily)
VNAQAQAAVRDAAKKAHTKHPNIALSLEVFEAFVAARLGPDAAIDSLRLDDLWLACACARGDEAAIRAVEASCFASIDAAVRRLGAQPALADEVRQMLRERLFTGASPRIAEYAGRGALARFIQAAATRTAIDLFRRTGKETLSQDALVDKAMPGDDPEIELLKRRYTADFRSAVRDAVLELDVEARNDLRFYYVDGLTLDDLAGLHHVQPSTVSRRLGKAREHILSRTRAILRERLRVASADVDSILRLVESRLEIGKSVLE